MPLVILEMILGCLYFNPVKSGSSSKTRSVKGIGANESKGTVLTQGQTHWPVLLAEIKGLPAQLAGFIALDLGWAP